MSFNSWIELVGLHDGAAAHNDDGNEGDDDRGDDDDDQVSILGWSWLGCMPSPPQSI